jgi:hypothetical protein
VAAYVDDVPLAVAGLCAATVVAIYGAAVTHYLFHRGMVGLWRRFGYPGMVAPLNYFIVTWAAGASWFAVFTWAVCRLIKQNGIDFRGGLNQMVMTHVTMVIALVVTLVVLMKVSQRNRRQGMLAVYGGSAFRLNVTDLVGAALGVAVLWSMHVFAR